MIVSDTWKFVIATPTKTGAQTIRAVAEKWVRHGFDAADLHQHWPLEHRMGIPEGCEDYDRWIMVRPPHRRLVSMFEYVRRPGNYRQWGHQVATENNFVHFLDWYADQRAAAEADGFGEKRTISGRIPWMWTDEYRTLHALVAGDIPEARQRWGRRPCGLIRLDQLVDGLLKVQARANARWAEEHGGDNPPREFRFPRPPTRNATKPDARLGGLTSWESYWWPSLAGREGYPGHIRDEARINELGQHLCEADADWLADVSMGAPTA